MKKTIALLLICLSLFPLLTACGEKEKPSEKVYRIALENQEISFSESSMSNIMLQPINAMFSSVMRRWTLSGTEILNLMSELLTDTENEVCNFKKLDADITESRSILIMPHIIITLQPIIRGPGDGVLTIFMGREQSRIYVCYNTLEALDEKKGNSIFYYIDAPGLERLFQMYYDGHISDYS